MNTLRKDAISLGGWGKSRLNRLSKISKHYINRRVDKRRRRIGKEIILNAE